MNKHKKKCNELKKIRKNLADKLGINLNQRECTFEGNCNGTCPKCEAEEKTLNRALVSAGAVLATSLCLVGCGGDIPDGNDILGGEVIIEDESGVDIEDIVLSGDVEYAGD